MIARLVRIVLALAVVAGAGYGGWWWWNERGPLVTVVPVTRGSAAEIVYATGVVEPENWAKVVPPVRARLVSHCRCEGRHVARGDVLAKLDESGPRAELAQAEARREFLSQELRRQTELASRGTGTRQGLERAQSEVAQYDAQIATIHARLADYTLVAPLDGMVLRADGDVGELASTATPLFWIGLPTPLRVVAEVNEEDIARVATGQKVLLRNDAFAQRTLVATIAAITPMGDPLKKTFRVYLGLPADTPLRIGMNVEANIVVAEKADALVVPAEALTGDIVFVLVGDKPVKRKVTVGLRGARGVEIVSGLTEGELVIAPVPSGLSTDRPVRRQDSAP